jgi:hypothetical protein
MIKIMARLYQHMEVLREGMSSISAVHGMWLTIRTTHD